MQKLYLNRHSKPSRSQLTSEQIVQSIKDDLINIKQRILKNIKENILDQCDEDTFYYCWSGLDLEIKVSIHIHINRLHSTEFPNMCQLIQIMVATAANSSPLKRSYTTKLQMVAAKQRNHFESKHLETLYLLATLNKELKPRKPSEYVEEIKLLE